MDGLIRFVFALLAGVVGFVPGGMVARALLGDRPRTGFDGVAEVVWGVIGGVLLGLILGILISGRLERSGRLWGLGVLVVLIGLEIAILLVMQ
ncbi:MAG TPA: hypothetical protein PL105_27400 [Caldilineaceae bacterium]|nr:hypothetical protein [Caldilineaceae bacterium]